LTDTDDYRPFPASYANRFVSTDLSPDQKSHLHRLVTNMVDGYRENMHPGKFLEQKVHAMPLALRPAAAEVFRAALQRLGGRFAAYGREHLSREALHGAFFPTSSTGYGR
jgi:CRISPR/Cas system endoribonuclease Cas6 (RAMP superfamily)